MARTSNFYEAEKTVRVHFPSNAICNDDSGTISYSMDLRIYTYDEIKNSWEAYPIFDFAESHDIFSCEVFDNTKHLCNADLEPIPDVNSVDLCVPCPKNLASSFELHGKEIDKNNKIKILANPFVETLIYQIFSEKESNFNVSLNSADGQMVFNSNVITSIGANNLQISGNDLTSGLYYLVLRGEGTSFTTKVFCVK